MGRQRNDRDRIRMYVVRLGEREESGMRERGRHSGRRPRSVFQRWANAKRERGNALCTEIDGGMERTPIRERACVSTTYGEGRRANERARGKTKSGDGEAIAVGRKGNTTTDREREDGLFTAGERRRRRRARCRLRCFRYGAFTLRPSAPLSVDVARPPIKAGKRGRGRTEEARRGEQRDLLLKATHRGRE